MIRRPVVLCLFAVFSNACYKYTNIRTDEVPVGAPVRVQLSDDGEQRIRDVVGLAGMGFNGRQLRGHVLRAEQDGVLLSVPWAARQNASWDDSQNIEQRIRVRHEEIRVIEMREIQRTKTAVIAASGATAVAFLIVRMLGGKKGGTVVTTSPGPDEMIATVVLLTLPLGLSGVH